MPKEIVTSFKMSETTIFGEKKLDIKKLTFCEVIYDVKRFEGSLFFVLLMLLLLFYRLLQRAVGCQLSVHLFGEVMGVDSSPVESE